ncbi:MAG: sugar phosphate isomerase/epimerase [SAR202 cluster bacterium]|jgi:sugar phosphate isomerase/epimerase|nr:sugar phosphate isomerase/epimerase family protein [Dehalococcoidia bacterium]MDP7613436.1 sugar phosphate isomerase/epimerase family protein [Dehalococcoidia bacterium]MQG47669.1 sugar phosphate isomerase/epimerase [SAR202 cluster bacterium]|tara:strand:+ start:63 stop:923 length:861 start_codon:yes stop_codon:yes gene_type:complete
MLLGVAGLVPGDWKTINTSVLYNAKNLGFKTVQIRVDDPQEINHRDIIRIKSLYQEFGFQMPQTVGQYGGGLVSKDEKHRKSTIKFVKRMINFTSKLEGQNTYLRPGSLHSEPWKPHPENYSSETFDRLIDSTKQICNVAESEGVLIAIEGGVACPVSSPQKVKDLIDAVGSKKLGLNMDPVNFIGSLEHAYNTTKLINEFYSLVPGRIFGCHAKDFTVIEDLLPHFEESIIDAPESLLDNEILLKGLESTNPKAHVLIEHLPDDKIPLAAEGIRRVAKRINIDWD